MPLTHLSQLLNVSRSGFYAWVHRPPSAQAQRDRQLRVLIRASYEASRRRYGSPRVQEDLIEQGVPISRKRVIRLMQAEGLKARVRKRFKRTTMSDHDQPVAANVLRQDFVAAAPNQRWVGDTTEFVIGDSGKLYLAAILDLSSRFLVGWAVSAINDRHLVIKALRHALQRRQSAAGLLHHSDQGSPYASEDYQRILEAYQPVVKVLEKDRHDRSRVLHCRAWQWANKDVARRRRRCGWPHRTCRGVPRIRSTGD